MESCNILKRNSFSDGNQRHHSPPQEISVWGYSKGAYGHLLKGITQQLEPIKWAASRTCSFNVRSDSFRVEQDFRICFRKRQGNLAEHKISVAV
jgi:hypothetical protein